MILQSQKQDHNYNICDQSLNILKVIWVNPFSIPLEEDRKDNQKFTVCQSKSIVKQSLDKSLKYAADTLTQMNYFI